MLPSCAVTASSSPRLSGIGEGRSRESRACESWNGHSGLQRLQNREEYRAWEADVFLQCRHSGDSRPRARGPWEQWTCHLPTWSILKRCSPQFHWLLCRMKPCGLRVAWAEGERFANKNMLFRESGLQRDTNQFAEKNKFTSSYRTFLYKETKLSITNTRSLNYHFF